MKKSYKKSLGLILALVMLASTVMSCGNRPEDETKPDNNVQSTGAGDKDSTATAESETEDPDAYLYEALPKTIFRDAASTFSFPLILKANTSRSLRETCLKTRYTSEILRLRTLSE